MYILARGKGLQGVINAINNVIEFLKTIIKFINSIFKSIGVALNIILQMSVKIVVWIATLPSWLIAFATITFIISMIYFIIGRTTGKSD